MLNLQVPELAQYIIWYGFGVRPTVQIARAQFTACIQQDDTAVIHLFSFTWNRSSLRYPLIYSD